MGAIPCAKLRWTIGAIERFKGASPLRHYFGAHLTEDGHRPRRREGVQCDWNPKIGPIIFAWVHNLYGTGRKSDPNTQIWKNAMIRRLDYEFSLERNPEQKWKPAISAVRAWMFQKLTTFIWCEWADFVGLEVDERDRKSLSFLYYPERYAVYATWPQYWSGNRKNGD